MNKKAFTVLEILIVAVISAIIFLIVFKSMSSNDEGDINAFVNPRAAQAQALQHQANELRRANDLKERELRLKEK